MDSIDSPDDTSELILKLERDIMAAIKDKDTATLEPMVAEDFIYRTHFGAESNKGEFLKSIAAFPFEILSIRGDELKLNVFGKTAVLTGVQYADVRTTEGRSDESAVAFTDVFIRREGQWFMVLAYGVELPSEPEPLEA